jgi:hypothetical protein
MKKLLIFFALLLTVTINSQTLKLDENFEYGASNDTSLVTLTCKLGTP